MRSSLTLFALACTFGVAEAQLTRPMPPAQLAGIRVWEDARTGQRPVPGTNDLEISWDVRFKNETNKELASVTIRFVSEEGNKRVFEGAPIELRQFENTSIPFKGSILPFNKTDFVHVTFRMPAKFFTRSAYVHPEFVGASVFAGQKDLHDVGHLFAWMFNHRGPETLAQFKQDPSLLKVRSHENLDVILMACATSDATVVQYAAEHGGGTYGDATTGGSTAMHLAAVGRYPENLDLVLKHGGKVDARAKSGRTPLIKAIEHGSVPFWKWLLEHKANPNGTDNSGRPPMYYAVHEGMLPAVRDLLAAGAKKYDAGGQGPLHYAVFNYVMLGPISDLGFPVDDADPKFGITPLMIASWSGWYEPQVWLLQHGADPNRKDKRGRTAFDYSRAGKPFFASLVKRFHR